MSRSTKWGDGAHLTRALFAQDKFWVTCEAQVLIIAEMESTHVLNTLLMIERMSDIPVTDLYGSALYKALYARLTLLLKLGETFEMDQQTDAGPEQTFTMPNRRIETRRSGITAMLRDLKEQLTDGACGLPQYRLHYRKENGEESHRTIQPTNVIERRVGLGFPELYLKGIDIDLMEERQFRADRILRIEEVPA